MTEAFSFSETRIFDFPTPESAFIAFKTLSVDDDLKPLESKTEFKVDSSSLVMTVTAKNEKCLKKAVNATLPSINLVKETILAFSK